MTKKTKKLKLHRLPVYLILIVLACIWIFPILVAFINVFKSPEDFLNSKFYQMPEKFGLFANLNYIMNHFKIFNYFSNSLIYAVFGTVLCIMVSSLAAYGMVKLKPKFHFFLFIIIYSGTIFPFQMYLLPLYKLYIATNLYDTKIGMILFYATICTPFAVFVYRGYYMTITEAIHEAAKIDGCGPISAFFQIYIPLLKIPTAVVIVFQAMWIWNDMLFGLVLAQSDAVRPIMVSIAQIAGEGGGNVPRLMLAVILTSIPTMALFICLRRYFIQGAAFNVTAAE